MLTRGQPPFGLRLRWLASMSLVLAGYARVVPLPYGVGAGGYDHTHEQTKEAQANLGKTETVYVGEHKVEGTEKQVYDPQEDGGESAKVETHRLQDQQHHGTVNRSQDSLRQRAVQFLHGCLPPLVTGFLS